MALMFINGFLAVNSYNIRISATQSYVPNELRGRFNGVFPDDPVRGQHRRAVDFGRLGATIFQSARLS